MGFQIWHLCQGLNNRVIFVERLYFILLLCEQKTWIFLLFSIDKMYSDPKKHLDTQFWIVCLLFDNIQAAQYQPAQF